MNALFSVILILFAPGPTDAGEGVTLDEVLAHADAHAPSNAVAQAERERGQASLRAATVPMADNPTVNVRVGPRLGGGAVLGTDVRLIVEQPVEIAGQRKRRIEAARREIDRHDAHVDEARWWTRVRVRAAFRGALVAQMRLEQAEEALRFHERLLGVARHRAKAGETSPIPVRLAAGDVARAQVRRIAAEQAYLAARFELAERSGWSQDAPPRPVGTLPRVRDAPPLPTLEASATRNHPSLRAGQAAVTERAADLRLARREAWPRPRFGVQFNREASAIPGDAALIVMGTVAVPIPVFTRNQGGTAHATAELRVSEAERTALQHRLRTRLTKAARVVDAAASRVEAYDEAILPSFEEDLALLERAYELGELGIIEVSVVQERLLSTQGEALDAYEAYVDALADLEGALGTDPWGPDAL